MKICFITYSIFNLGGVQRVVSVLASELSKVHEVHILCTTDKYIENRTLYNLDDRVKIYLNSEIMNSSLIHKLYNRSIIELHKRTNLFRPKLSTDFLIDRYYPKVNRNKLIEFINYHQFDIVIGVEGIYSMLLSLISDDIKAKTIGWQHNSYEAYLRNPMKYYWKQEKIFNKLIPRLDKYIVLTEYDKRKYNEVNGIRVENIPNPRSFSSQRKSSLKCKNFLAAGRYNHQKGFDMLIEAFYIFAQKNNDWNLYIVGDGEEKNKLTELIEKYNLTHRVHLKPFTDKIEDYFLNTSALLLSSRWEGMPMITLESLEMGVPIISFNISAIHPIVTDSREGLIVESFNVNKFSEAMYKISSSYEYRLGLGRNALVKSTHFDSKQITEQWLELFERLQGKEDELCN